MKVPRGFLSSQDCELKRILDEQGFVAFKNVLEAEFAGASLREHAKTCADCSDIIRRIYPDGVIPVRHSS
jgi:hypothetical protein